MKTLFRATVEIGLCAVISLTCFSSARQRLSADEWIFPGMREFWSPQRKVMLRVTPADHPLDHPGHCLAQLYRSSGAARELVWSRHLVNNVAPLDAVVADSGEYVVTFDEWGHYGTLPVVIYGERGALVRTIDLDAILIPYDGKYDGPTAIGDVPAGGTSGPDWRKHTLIFLGPEEKSLFLRLSGGGIRILRLSDGTVMTDGWYRKVGGPVWQMPQAEWKTLTVFAANRTPELAVEYLSSEDPDQRETGAILSGQLRLRKAIPKLRTLLGDGAAYYQGTDASRMVTVYFVRDAARHSLQLLGENVETNTPPAQSRHTTEKDGKARP
jgi:hypothetical protein